MVKGDVVYFLYGFYRHSQSLGVVVFVFGSHAGAVLNDNEYGVVGFDFFDSEDGDGEYVEFDGPRSAES
jgi:hypothetical protein